MRENSEVKAKCLKKHKSILEACWVQEEDCDAKLDQAKKLCDKQFERASITKGSWRRLFKNQLGPCYEVAIKVHWNCVDKDEGVAPVK